ncbi:MAG TPA: VWA domain-containing protein [Longimicrobiales bacterium]|nr:VWA domain-containing protein [Longimicrobiales bacterium]
MKTSILLDHEPVEAARVVRLLLRLEAETTGRTDRLPLNLSLVLDRSGSMYGGKLEAARAAAALLVRRLSPDDTVSVVAYDDEVRTVAEPAKGAAQAALPRQIEAIETGGSTNLSGGWLRGRELGALADTFAAHSVSEADQKYMYHRAYNSMTGRRKKDELIRRKNGPR